MIPGKPQDAPVRKSATCALLFLLAAALAACSGLAASNEESSPVLDPNYKQLVAERLRSEFKDYASYDQYQIAEPRRVRATSGWSWVICVRFQDRNRPRSHALYLQSSTINTSRYAVETDGCDGQAYVPFELMTGSGLQPLH